MSKAIMCGRDCKDRMPCRDYARYGSSTPKMCENDTCEVSRSWMNRIPETDLRISVAKLKEVLEKLVADGDIEPIHVSVGEIINRVKKDI